MYLAPASIYSVHRSPSHIGFLIIYEKYLLLIKLLYITTKDILVDIILFKKFYKY